MLRIMRIRSLRQDRKDRLVGERIFEGEVERMKELDFEEFEAGSEVLLEPDN
jgi:hypothetical protein